MPEQETIQLGKRWYKRVGVSTLEHDHWLAGHARQAGSDGWAIRPGESHEAFGSRILGDLMANEKAFLLLGGLLMPSDEEVWTKDLARATAAEMARLTDPDEKRIANTELLSLVLDFFVNGLAYWMISETSSEAEGAPAKIEAAASSASGAQLSD